MPGTMRSKVKNKAKLKNSLKKVVKKKQTTKKKTATKKKMPMRRGYWHEEDESKEDDCWSKETRSYA